MSDDPSLVVGYIQHAKNALECIKLAISVVREIRGGVTNDEQKRTLDRALADAEKAQQLALAEIGKSFGYKLCRCTVPPQVCTRIGYDRLSGVEHSKCPKCGQEYPVKVDTIPSPGYGRNERI